MVPGYTGDFDAAAQRNLAMVRLAANREFLAPFACALLSLNTAP